MERYAHGGNVYEPHAGNWLDFSANINPLGLSSKVKSAMEGAIDHLIHYPDPEARMLKEALAIHYRVPQEQLVLGNGAAELIYLICYRLRPRRALLLAPTFSEYEKAARAAGAEIAYHALSPEDGFALDETALLQTMQGVDIVFLANPNNPTGATLEKDAMLRILDKAEAMKIHVVVDESFLEFLPSAKDYTVRWHCSDHRHLIVLQSMTKFYAIPGLRLGFAVASERLAERLSQGKDVWNVNYLAQVAGASVVFDRAYQAATHDWLQREGIALQQALSSFVGIEVYDSAVNFILFRIGADAPVSAKVLLQSLKEQGILLRDCSNYRALDERYLRTAVRDREENERLLHAIKRIWEEGRA